MDDGDGQFPRLFVLCAGNTEDAQAWNTYPASLSTNGVRDPGQAWNALTIGAFTNKVNITEANAWAAANPSSLFLGLLATTIGGVPYSWGGAGVGWGIQPVSDIPGGIADDAAIAARIGELDRQNRQAIPPGLQQALEGGSQGQRHIAIENQRLARSGKGRQRLGNRMPGTELRLLQSPGNIGRINGRPHRFPPMSENHDQLCRGKRTRGVDAMLHQGLACHGMQDFWQIGMHALALAGGKDDYLYRRFSHFFDSGNDEGDHSGRLRIIA